MVLIVTSTMPGGPLGLLNAPIAAGDKLGEGGVGRHVFLLLLGVAVALWMLAMLTNFRGMREDNLRRSVQGAQAYGWNRGHEDPEMDRMRQRFAKVMQRVVCSIFLLVGIGMAVAGGIGTVLALRA
ncbi:hypothetical protein CS0771_42790 [Catellatospora sp. IY07-71]|uniref:hypothetical protein n=1 Tax=Catellatospora sp. IY07-71 TaxID=2728827 RepID=UPI001BB36643|nr:hypothetical protein [Catellatospora sp. IY07-71]BCJ74735.1 hypothetical protein CS0771_42790 [Catellatospora sp. IY07-71]